MFGERDSDESPPAINPVPPGQPDHLNSSMFEKYCRNVLEWFFDFLPEDLGRFTKIRPDWLRNPRTRRRLEIDCYNEYLRLAVECDGQGHEDPRQKARDEIKDTVCRDRGLLLLRIPIPPIFEREYGIDGYDDIPFIVRDILEDHMDWFPQEIVDGLIGKIAAISDVAGVRPALEKVKMIDAAKKEEVRLPIPRDIYIEDCAQNTEVETLNGCF